MMRQSGADAGLEVRLRTLRILWGIFLTTVGLYVLVTVFARPSEEVLREGGRDNPALLMILAVAGLSTVSISFVVKRHFYGRAAERQDPAVFHQGFILAIVLCETAVLFGLVGLFITWNTYAYLLFVLGALGMLLHFPRREQLLAAYFKKNG
jgi:F0F1-type ATP synthase membrane subunit c/vacuolar-type H+-ATPase subunit K